MEALASGRDAFFGGELGGGARRGIWSLGLGAAGGQDGFLLKKPEFSRSLTWFFALLPCGARSYRSFPNFGNIAMFRSPSDLFRGPSDLFRGPSDLFRGPSDLF